MRDVTRLTGPGVSLAALPTRGATESERAKEQLATMREAMLDLQDRLWARKRASVLVLLQGMDTAGKDGTIRKVFSGLLPQALEVHAFVEPSPEEARHDFLWRYHQRAPLAGRIGVFNRSWYEGVLVERVDRLVAPALWRARYRQINDFERHLAENGTVLAKVFLHVSKREQGKRLEARREDPDKHWKHNPHDLVKRKQWSAYQAAYQDALRTCSTPRAPWHVVPADTKPARSAAVARVVLDALRRASRL